MKTRAGHEARIICTDRNHAEYPIVALIDETHVHTYTKNFEFSINEITSMDLIPNQVELGETYIDGTDTPVRIICVDGDTTTMPVVGIRAGECEWYTIDGKYNHNKDKHPWDLILD